jgi:HD-GYP domain-containing protein (c-di-GMP phosphodiesterase class II)
MGSGINSVGAYYFDDNSVLKYLRKVLAEINPGYVDCGIRSAFLLKRYIERYKVYEDNPAKGSKLALLCMLKDIGTYYKSGVIPRSNHALAAASSYAFMHNCSPFGEDAKPLLFYQSKYLEDTYDPDQQAGMLMTLVNQIVEYNYQEYTVPEMVELIKKDKRNVFNPDQVTKMFKLLKEQPDIYEKLNDRNSIFIYETSKYISSANYTVEELMGFIDMATYAFEFHNSETLAHTVTVAAIAEELARLSKLPDSMIAEIRLASLIHDIGKIRVPLEILCYPGRLNQEMYEEMKKHVIYTREIVTGCFSYKIVDIASHHHEKIDGSGYPDGLRERDLSVGDKIIAIADIASALYCKRSYKDSFSDETIIELLKKDVALGKLDKRIFNHLVNNWENIMAITKGVESNVIEQYNAMRQEFAALSKSKVLFSLFDYEDTYRSIFDNDERDNENTYESEEPIANEVEELEANEEAVEPEENVVEEAIEDEVLEAEEELEEIEDEPEEVSEIDEAEEQIEDELVEEESEESGELFKEIANELNEDEEDFESYVNSLSDKKEEASNDDEFEAFISNLEEKENKNEVVVEEVVEDSNEELEEEIEELEELEDESNEEEIEEVDDESEEEDFEEDEESEDDEDDEDDSDDDDDFDDDEDDSDDEEDEDDDDFDDDEEDEDSDDEEDELELVEEVLDEEDSEEDYEFDDLVNRE